MLTTDGSATGGEGNSGKKEVPQPAEESVASHSCALYPFLRIQDSEMDFLVETNTCCLYGSMYGMSLSS